MAKEWHITGYEKPESERLIEVDWLVSTEILNDKAGAKLAFERGDSRAKEWHNVEIKHMEGDVPFMCWKFINGEWI
jgi:hypothetical protein